MAQDEAILPTSAEGASEGAMSTNEALLMSALPFEPSWLVEHLEQVPPPPESAWDDPLFWGEEARDRSAWKGRSDPSGRWYLVHCGWGANERSVTVYDTFTRHTVWEPAGAILIDWSPEGDEIATICEKYTYNPALHRIIGSPLQSEFRYSFERYTWPTLHRLGGCTLQMPTGWPVQLDHWPTQQVAVFQWRDQSESGLEFIHVSEAGDQQLQNAGFPEVERWTRKTFYPPGGIALATTSVIGPAFSPRGRFIALGLPGNFDTEGHLIMPTGEEATLFLGELLLLDWQERSLGRLMVTTAAGTIYPFITQRYPHDLFRTLAFLGEERLELTLPNESRQVFQFQREGIWIRPRQKPLDL
jgi:hypothetical protein